MPDVKERNMEGVSVNGLPADRNTDSDLEIRIRGEFAEMPGLRLTLPQASRFFNVERSRCERILAGLVAHGDLSACCGSFRRAGYSRAQ
jgi:hypothetical protein